MTKTINRFIGEHAFLSNFYPCFIKHEGRIYPSVENAFQAMKTLSPVARDSFLDCKASAAKKIGKSLTLRPDWDNIKVGLMEELLKLKFNQTKFMELLLKTEDAELIEGNWWGDEFWGVSHGRGENVLGKLLMEIRQDLRMRNTEEARYGY